MMPKKGFFLFFIAAAIFALVLPTSVPKSTPPSPASVEILCNQEAGVFAGPRDFSDFYF